MESYTDSEDTELYNASDSTELYELDKIIIGTIKYQDLKMDIAKTETMALPKDYLEKYTKQAGKMTQKCTVNFSPLSVQLQVAVYDLTLGKVYISTTYQATDTQTTAIYVTRNTRHLIAWNNTYTATKHPKWSTNVKDAERLPHLSVNLKYID